MNQEHKKIDHYINQLNSQKIPKEHRSGNTSDEFQVMADTVRKIRSMREPEMPDADFEKRLISGLSGNVLKKYQPVRGISNKTVEFSKNKSKRLVKRTLISVTAAAAAAAIIFSVSGLPAKMDFLPGILSPDNTSIAYAMEQAFKGVKAYHGMIEVVETNELGEQMLQSKREVWADQEGNYYLKDLEGFSKGMITVNDTKKEWQIRPEEKKAYLSAAFPDPYRFTFELGNEVKDVQRALFVKEIGEETISGREATVLEVTPEGGAAYRLWVDKKTDLPLKRQSAMQNALQVTISYTDIEYMDTIPEELLTYQLPQGYEEVEMFPEQIVTTLEEAESIARFTPVIPNVIPEDFELGGIAVLTDTPAIKLYYVTSDSMQTVVIQQSEVAGELEPASDAILGTVNNTTAEILNNYQGLSGINSIRWQENGMEYTVFGNISVDGLAGFANGLTQGDVILPQADENTEQPQIEVPVDLTVEENEQKSVDAGHSPWKLDPVFVTQVFSSLLISPEGIVGDYPIAYDDIEIVQNDGVEAKARINSENSIAEYVYLKRLVRQDETGIWTVVGYDSANTGKR
jgi:outer membrane lipoprotein-sorting protein